MATQKRQTGQPLRQDQQELLEQMVQADFLDTLTRCQPVTQETIRKEKLSTCLDGAVLKMIAPLM